MRGSDRRPGVDSSEGGGPGSDGAALRPGARVEEYEVQRVLGGGGFGITYLARDAHLDLPVAIKEHFPADLLTRGPHGRVQPRHGDIDAQHRFQLGLQRFVDEARALATFRHPHIVRVLRYFRANGTAYIVMEYESGLSLKRWLPRQGALTLEALRSIVLPLLDGLAAVHAAGFLHRDIKPDNIYVREGGAPVLLDFGAARRLMPHGEMTTIVSPGFAPFEQYHAQGDQGPWTDIYSLGAVMYWMVTGQRPLESAARIQADGLLPALRAGDAVLFGAPLLRAIDWALQPDPGQRPQSVAQLREAIQGEAHTLPAGSARFGASVSTPNTDTAFAALRRRNLLCTILFLDLVGYSSRSVDDQVAIKKLLNDLVARTLRDVAPDGRLAIDTGDGAALCFVGDPEEALHAALRLRELLDQHCGPQLPVRMGLNLGPVRVVTDVNNRTNVIGDGINVAQRIMDFARPNQVLVSRAYHDVICRITDDTARMFRYVGPHPDKHGRVHEVHAVVEPQQLPDSRGDDPGGYTRTLPVAPGHALDTAAVEDMEADLARRIGPMARVLVAKARRRAPSLQALREALAPLILDLSAREAFLAGRDDPHAAGRGTRTAWRVGESSGPPWPGSSRPPLPDALMTLEQALCRQVGPMARMLLRQQLDAHCDTETLIAALCAQIDAPAAREEFRALAQRLLRRGG